VIDDYTVEITLETSFAPFPAGLAVPGCSIYNREATEAKGTDSGLEPAGTGPFKLVKWDYNNEIVLEAHDDYWNGRAKLDGITIKIVPDAETQRMMFENGELDVFDLDSARSQIPYFRDNPNYKIEDGLRVGTYYLCLNQDMEPFNNINERRAIQYAIDRELLLETLYYGTGGPAKGILGMGLAGYNPDLPGFEFDPDKAKALLEEAGYAPGECQLEIWQTVDSPQTLAFNETLQAMLADVGISVTIKQVDSASFYAIRGEGEVPMYFSSWSADFNDPDNFLYTFFGAQNPKSRSFNYWDEEVRGILEQCRQISDPEERYRLYQEAEYKIVYEDAAWVPLFHLKHLFVVQPWVNNFQVSWNGWSSMSYYSIDIDTNLK
jgi:ABC-type transport system substrate-binding protein